MYLNYKKVRDHIVNWLSEYKDGSGLEGFVVGVSGGVDSAVVSTLCALTAEPTICVAMPAEWSPVLDRANKHMKWLTDAHPNVEIEEIDITGPYRAYEKCLRGYKSPLAMANLQSRLRMLTLYAISNTKNYLVVGTGNKVEDYGVMFFTLGGDGQVDVSPIGDLLKTEVRQLADFLEIDNEIVTAEPTDGLWRDNRSDEDAIGATYEELEWAMKFCDEHLPEQTEEAFLSREHLFDLDEKKIEILGIYLDKHKRGLHKITPLPVCKIPVECRIPTGIN